MRRHLWLVVVATLGISAQGVAQYKLPPGTQMPDTPQAKTDTLTRAEDKIDHQDFVGGRTLIEEYLSLHPADARALFDRGYLEQVAHQNDQAAADYQKAIAADPKQFESRLAMGLLLAQQGKVEEARRLLVQATLLTPSPPNPAASAQAFRALAALDRTTDPAMARDALLSALRLSPETPEDLLLTAQIAEANGDDDTAERAYRRLLAGQPSPDLVSEANGGLAHLLMKQLEYGEAERILKAQLSRNAEDAARQAQLATALIAQGKNDEALPVLEKLRQLEPDNPSVDQMLADAYSQAGHPEIAAPLYAKMDQSRPDDPELLAAQGKNLIRQADYRQAQEVLERAVKLKPDNGEAWSGLAFAASQNQQYSTALQALSMRAKYLPETPASYFLWATSYDNLHQSLHACQYYRQFLAADQGKLPDQEWQAKQRLRVLGRIR